MTMTKLTGTGDNGNVAQQAEDLWAEQGAVPQTEELVEESLRTGKWFLVAKNKKKTLLNHGLWFLPQVPGNHVGAEIMSDGREALEK